VSIAFVKVWLSVQVMIWVAVGLVVKKVQQVGQE